MTKTDKCEVCEYYRHTEEGYYCGRANILLRFLDKCREEKVDAMKCAMCEHYINDFRGVRCAEAGIEIRELDTCPMDEEPEASDEDGENAIIINGRRYELVNARTDEYICETCDLLPKCQSATICTWLFGEVENNIKHFKRASND